MHIKVRTTYRSIFENISALVMAAGGTFAAIELYRAAAEMPRMITPHLSRSQGALVAALLLVGCAVWEAGHVTGQQTVRATGSGAFLIGMAGYAAHPVGSALLGAVAFIAFFLAAKIDYKQN